MTTDAPQAQTDTEIRELEIEAAKVMGWTIERSMVPSNMGGLRPYCTLFDGNKEQRCARKSIFEHLGDTDESWNNLSPRFARDPAAIVEALEWFTDKGGYICRKDYRPGSPFEASADKLPPGDGVVCEIDSSLGIAICRAIVALKPVTV
jgi:hypothetical protein